jgi:ribosome-associated toxin RatA of RatAB toxin-antitoxin module
MSAESGTESIEIKATPDEVFRVMTDIDAFPKWMDEFKEAAVLARDEQGRPTRASFELDAKIKTVRYILDYTYPEGGLAWENEEGGDVKLIKGSYILTPSADATTVTYNFEIDPGFPVPSFIRRQAVKMIVSRALGGLKKRVESGA